MSIVSFSATPDVLSEQQQTRLLANFSLTAPTPASGLAIDFDFSDSTAVGGSDFEIDFAASSNIVSIDFLPDGSGGTVNLAGGVTTATVVAVPLIDADTDSEILTIQLIDGEGFDLDPNNNSFTATITDEPIVSFSGTPDVLSEQQQTQLFGTFSLTAPTPASGLAIDFDFSDSTAVGGSDFEIDFAASSNIVSVDFLPDGSGGTINLAGGVTTATLVAVPLIDADTDSEIISFQLIDGEGFDLDPDNNSVTATIVDFNEIIGGNGKDFLKGDRRGAPTKNDLIDGGNGKDTLVGGAASDILLGGNGKDLLRGGNAGDTLLGGAGSDILRGNNGKDFLRGGEGNDTINGGNGADIFVLAEGEGTDRVTDFGNGGDVIGLADGLTFADLSFSGSDIIVTATSETLATLTGTNTTTLTADDFIIV
ncbi:MAG: hypothetical protein QNJ51_19535 [Calothrix sp. MO_167.B12]|nr:hypothetical protein [Calothrix sp. MO_167.B12]